MLIKLYTRGAINYLRIIDGVKNVSVRGQALTTLDLEEIKGELVDLEHLEFNCEPFVLVDYDQDGKKKILKVYNKAYICNDEGKTVEPVFVDYYARADRACSTREIKSPL